MKISGKEIIDTVPGSSLLYYAITKLYMEGRNRYEIGKTCELLAWDIYRCNDFKLLPQAPDSTAQAQAEGGTS